MKNKIYEVKKCPAEPCILGLPFHLNFYQLFSLKIARKIARSPPYR